MFLAWRNRDYVARTDFFGLASPALDSTATGNHE
jgi:hypothetical protein